MSTENLIYFSHRPVFNLNCRNSYKVNKQSQYLPTNPFLIYNREETIYHFQEVIKMRILRSFILWALLLKFSIMAVYAIAPAPPHRPFSIDLGDGLVFHATHQRDLEHGYPITGLYRDGKLVYAVNSPPHHWGELFFSYDGMSFLEVRSLTTRWHGRPSRVRDIYLGSPAVRYYYMGNLTHFYSWSSLVNIRNSVVFTDIVTADWDIPELRYHDRSNNTLQIITRDQRRIIFDLSTGLIEENTRNISAATIVVFWVFVSCILLLGGIFLLTHLLTRKTPPPDKSITL